MKAAIVPATIAWAVGVCVMLVIFYYDEYTEAHLRGDPFSVGSSVFEALYTLCFFGLVYGVGVAAVVFPLCLLVVVPLLRFLPRSSPLWWPPFAATIGAAAGPLAMYVWSAALRFEFYLPSAHDSNQVWGAVAALLVGAAFGYLYAKSIRTARA